MVSDSSSLFSDVARTLPDPLIDTDSCGARCRRDVTEPASTRANRGTVSTWRHRCDRDAA
jgi:hypothetical protein